MDTQTAGTPQVWFITGCSTGFGAALTEEVLKRGDLVFATARRPEQIRHFQESAPDQCRVGALDVLDMDSINAAVAQAQAWAGRIDVLVNNAGYGLVGALEEVSDEEAMGLLETNVLGIVKVLRAVLPGMRARGGGHVVNISSMGGLVGFAGMGLYSASKFAVEGLSEALALETAPFGIKVTIVEPGPFRTRFRGGLLHAQKELAPYAQTVGKLRQTMADASVKPPGDPVRAAQAIIKAVTAAQPPLRLPLGQICYEKTEDKLRIMSAEMASWKDVALDTAFQD